MNYASRRRRYYLRPRYSRAFRRNYFNSSRSKRRATGNQRAAAQQRDTTQVNLSIPTQIECGNSTFSINGSEIGPIGVYALNIWDVMRQSEFYKSYANMYDQVRIDKVTCKLTPYQFPIFTNGTGIGNYYNSYTVVTAWDRTGLSEEQLYLNAEYGSKEIGNANDSEGLYVVMGGKEISTYSSAFTRSVNPNSSVSISRSIYPTSMSEKSYFVNTSDIDTWYTGYDPSHYRYWGITSSSWVGSMEDVQVTTNAEDVVTVPTSPLVSQFFASNFHAKNPCVPIETSSVPFKPTLLVGIQNEPIYISGINDQFTPKMKFNVECDVVVTFRGLRKASVVK